MKSPKLPLTNEERTSLRKAKIKLAALHELSMEKIIEVTGVSNMRAEELKGLATFQQIPSIGPKIAEAMVYTLGYYALDELKGEKGAEILDRHERKLGFWVDPCVEDAFRCIVHHSNNPNSKKQWFDFTSGRKHYRETYGYPANRPKTPWFS